LPALVQSSVELQLSTWVHNGQVDAWPGTFDRKWPGMHCGHSESVAVVHVSSCMQLSTSVQSRQTVAGPLSSSQYPSAHCVQRDVESLSQVSVEMQWSTDVQSEQMLEGPTLLSQVPSAHSWHCEVRSPSQVTGEMQLVTGWHTMQLSPDPGAPF
jgi:hypothetical protein